MLPSEAWRRWICPCCWCNTKRNKARKKARKCQICAKGSFRKNIFCALLKIPSQGLHSKLDWDSKFELKNSKVKWTIWQMKLHCFFTDCYQDLLRLETLGSTCFSDCVMSTGKHIRLFHSPERNIFPWGPYCPFVVTQSLAATCAGLHDYMTTWLLHKQDYMCDNGTLSNWDVTMWRVKLPSGRTEPTVCRKDARTSMNVNIETSSSEYRHNRASRSRKLDCCTSMAPIPSSRYPTGLS